MIIEILYFTRFLRYYYQFRVVHIDRNAMITVTVQRVQIEDIIKNILHLFLIKHETLFVQSHVID